VNKFKQASFCVVCALAAGGAHASVILADGNSQVSIDPTSLMLPSERGLNSWTVDGTEQLKQEWYWFRIGNGPEQTIDSIGAPVVTQLGSNYVNIVYANNTVKMDLTLVLTGGEAGSHGADIAETFRVTNLTNSVLDFHAFEYNDFNLTGTPQDDTAQLLNSSTIFQSDLYHQVTVGAVPIPTHWQIGTVPNILNALTDGLASNLSDGVASTDPTDAAFAFQWDKKIAARGTFIVSKDKLMEVGPVPEPSAIVAVLGAGVLFLRRRRA
jgi:hypothetical protein